VARIITRLNSEASDASAHVEEPLPEISKADVVDRDSPISSNGFRRYMAIDRSCEGIVPHMCD